jgi:hypothetical protein
LLGAGEVAGRAGAEVGLAGAGLRFERSSAGSGLTGAGLRFERAGAGSGLTGAGADSAGAGAAPNQDCSAGGRVRASGEDGSFIGGREVGLGGAGVGCSEDLCFGDFDCARAGPGSRMGVGSVVGAGGVGLGGRAGESRFEGAVGPWLGLGGVAGRAEGGRAALLGGAGVGGVLLVGAGLAGAGFSGASPEEVGAGGVGFGGASREGVRPGGVGFGRASREGVLPGDVGFGGASREVILGAGGFRSALLEGAGGGVGLEGLGCASSWCRASVVFGRFLGRVSITGDWGTASHDFSAGGSSEVGVSAEAWADRWARWRGARLGSRAARAPALHPPPLNAFSSASAASSALAYRFSGLLAIARAITRRIGRGAPRGRVPSGGLPPVPQ